MSTRQSWPVRNAAKKTPDQDLEVMEFNINGKRRAWSEIQVPYINISVSWIIIINKILLNIVEK